MPGSDLVRELLDSLNRRDLDGVVATLHPDVEWFDQAAIPTEEPHRGTVAVRAHFQTWLDSWEELSYEIEELIEDGDQIVLMLNRRARPTAGGDEVADRAAYVVAIQGDKIGSFAGYSTRDAAIEGAGLKDPHTA